MTSVSRSNTGRIMSLPCGKTKLDLPKQSGSLEDLLLAATVLGAPITVLCISVLLGAPVLRVAGGASATGRRADPRQAADVVDAAGPRRQVGLYRLVGIIGDADRRWLCHHRCCFVRRCNNEGNVILLSRPTTAARCT